MAFDFQEWFTNLTKYDSVLSYEGLITPDVVNEILNDSESFMLDKGLSKKKVKRAYNAVVEGVQNLYHHSIPEPKDENKDNRFGAFCVRVRNEDVSVTMGNYVLFDKVSVLKDRMNQINVLDKDELKALYKKILSNLEFSDKGGGGLGMVDMAKRTGSKLHYSFFEFDEKYSFFELEINV